MGFLKRIFSIGSKKNKKSKQQISHPYPLNHGSTPLLPVEEDQEAAASRLLRSSSARFAVVAELDYANLPPIPHPINNVINTPAASTVSIASTSLSQRGSYNVTVHRRKRHTSTEFPDANPGFDDQRPTSNVRNSTQRRETENLLGLRSDPSVASLIDLYDEHGRLPLQAFSNTPPEGRVQTRRNGSTLRQLLGDPASSNGNNDYSTAEGDISWAERVLGETDSVTSASSLGLRTPDDLTAHFPHNPLINNVHHDLTLSTDHDLSLNSFDNPAISSMEVEVSSNADSSLQHDNQAIRKSPYDNPDPTTPQRASQIFGFLTSKGPGDRRKSLPQLPSVFSSPSDEDAQSIPPHSRFSDTSADSILPSTISYNPEIPMQHDTTASDTIITSTRTLRLSRPSIEAISMPQPSPSDLIPRGLHNSGPSSYQGDGQQEAVVHHKVKVLMNGPTKVIVTAPTPSANRDDTPPPSRIPRGPRAPSRHRSEGRSSRPTLTERSNTGSGHAASHPSNDKFTYMPRRSRSHTHNRSVSASTTSSIDHEVAMTLTNLGHKSTPEKHERNGGDMPLPQVEKENSIRAGLSANAPLPFTPVRSNSGFRSSLFRTAVDPSMFKPPTGMVPSPASSSELSPVGKQMMTNLRQQRTKARQTERSRKRRG